MTRAISALLLGALVVLAVLAAPPLPIALLVAAAAVLGTREMASLFVLGGVRTGVAPLITGSLIMVAGAALAGNSGLAGGLVLALALLVWDRVRVGVVPGATAALSAGALTLLFPTWSLAHIVLYLDLEGGRASLLFVLAAVWACDTAAYYGGTAFGRTRLAPSVSPNKTVEGLGFGLLGGLAVGFAFWLWGGVGQSLGFSMASGVCLAGLGQLGDLMESLFKRGAGVKDSGKLIPGHGGILDRIDALLLSVPIYYYLVLIQGSFRP